MVIRYGIVIEGNELVSWQLACLERLRAPENAELRCILELASPSRADQGKSRWTEFLTAQGVTGRFEVGCSTADFVSAYPTVKHLPHPAGDDVPPDLAGTIRSLELDFLLLFHVGAYRRQLKSVASFGVWCLFQSDPSRFQSDATSFWELYHDHDVGGAALVQLGDDANSGVLLRAAYFAMNRTRFAPNVNEKLSSLIELPTQACRDLQAGQKARPAGPAVSLAATSYGYPSRLQLMQLGARLRKNLISKHFRNQLFRMYWNIGRVESRFDALLGNDVAVVPTPMLRHSHEEYFADPCAVEESTTTFVFCERFRYATNRGEIAVIEQRADSITTPLTVITESFHLSYPQIFRHGGDVFCIPESTSQRSVLLYKAIRFPREWQRVGVILENFAAVDSTLMWWSDRWWLFCTNADEGYNSHLHIWHAPDLIGPWVAHARNPVKIDVRSSGPAGPFVVGDDNCLYRPAQDCSRSYGRRILVNKIDVLTALEFKESLVGTIASAHASTYNQGLHTISIAGKNVIVDMLRYDFQPRGLIGLATGSVGSLARRLGMPETTIAKLKRRLQKESRAD